MQFGGFGADCSHKGYEDYNRDNRLTKFMIELSEEEMQSMGFIE